jgi:hypothetical protein
MLAFRSSSANLSAMGKRGPATALGREAVRRNAVKPCPERSMQSSSRRNGARALSPVIPDESPEDWQDHLSGIFESLQPVGHLEEQDRSECVVVLYCVTVVATEMVADQCKE